ncbi:MAG: CPBP family intramembrane glutamic endopeptidase [Acidimicrobiia bacterium]|jgi:membrane protease YdiL (CAAX protease family)
MNRSSASRAETRTFAPALAVTAAALVAGGTIPLLPPRARLAANLGAAAAALALARAGGVDRTGLGGDPADAWRGVRVGAGTAAATAMVVGAAAVLPATRELFTDARVTGAPRGRAAYEVLVRIPVATALGEELLFRGALLGAWQAAAGTPVAVAVSSLAFGAWHVIPALESHTHNPAGARISAGNGGRVTHVGGTIVATALAGAAFAALRLRSRSLVAPVIAHTAINQLGYLAARWAHAPAAAPLAQP